MKQGSISRQKLEVFVNPGKDLQLRKPEQASDKSVLRGPCTLRGEVTLYGEEEWMMVPAMPGYGIPLYERKLGALPQRKDRQALASTITQRSLHEDWGEERIEVSRLNDDGTTEEFF